MRDFRVGDIVRAQPLNEYEGDLELLEGLWRVTAVHLNMLDVERPAAPGLTANFWPARCELVSRPDHNKPLPEEPCTPDCTDCVTVGACLSEAGTGNEPVDTIPSDSSARKNIPLASGLLDYFPAALAEIAKVSKYGNDKHNPGQPLHHARGKSTDHADALLRHLVDRGRIDKDTGMRHSAEVGWRALALLQQELEDAGLAPLPRGAKNPVEDMNGDR